MVSVIIPAFNCAEFITETLESVYQQTYTNREIVLIDDGSTDNTRSVLEPHMDRIRYFYQENRGTAAARNAGIQRSRGELIAFLDHDDLWLPEKLELQVKAMQTYPECGLVFTDGKYFDESGILRNSLIPKHIHEWIDQHGTTDPMVVMGWISREICIRSVISSASSILVRKHCLERVGYFDEGIHVADDYDLALRVAQLYPVIFLRSCLYLWRYRQESQSGSKGSRHYRWTKASISVIEKNWQIMPKEIRSAVRARLSRMYWQCGRFYFDQNRFRDARKMFLGSLYYDTVFVPAIIYLLASHVRPSFIDRIRSIKRRVSMACQDALGANIHR